MGEKNNWNKLSAVVVLVGFLFTQSAPSLTFASVSNDSETNQNSQSVETSNDPTTNEIGVFSVITSDDFKAGKSENNYFIKTSSGNNIELHFSGDIPKSIRPGSKVSVNGQETIDQYGRAHLSVSSTATGIQLLPESQKLAVSAQSIMKTQSAVQPQPADDCNSTNPSGPGTLCRQSFAIVIVTVNSGKPLVNSEIAAERAVQVDKFYRDNSFGKTWFTGVHDSNAKADIYSVSVNYDIQSASRMDYGLIDTVKAAIALNYAGQNLEVYRRVTFLIGGTSFKHQGVAELDGSYSFAYDDDPNAGLMIHEIGHTLGFRHAGALPPNCDFSVVGPNGCDFSQRFGAYSQLIVYGDMYDTMGGGGLGSGHLNAPHMEQAQYFDSINIAVYDNSGEKNYALSPIENLANGQLQAIKIFYMTDKYYYLAYRKEFGVLDIHYAFYGEPATVQIADLAPGQVYTDSKIGLTVEALQINASTGKFELRVTNRVKETPCHVNEPTFVVTPQSQTAVIGQTIRYNISTTNNDVGCGGGIFLGSVGMIDWQINCAGPLMDNPFLQDGETSNLTCEFSNIKSTGHFEIGFMTAHLNHLYSRAGAVVTADIVNRDLTPPEVAITNPIQGATINVDGAFSVSGNAMDRETGIDKVQITVTDKVDVNGLGGNVTLVNLVHVDPNAIYYPWTFQVPVSDVKPGYKAKISVTASNSSDVWSQPTDVIVNIASPTHLNQVPDQTMNEGEELTVALTKPGENISLSNYEKPNFATYSFSNDQIFMTFKPGFEDAGVYRVREVEDNQDGVPMGELVFNVTVNNVIRPPVIQPIPDQTMNEGQTKIIPIIVSAPDHQMLRLSASNMPGFANVMGHSDGTAEITLKPLYLAAGNYSNLMINIEDESGHKTSTQFNLQVNNYIVPPPVLHLNVNPKSVTAGQSFTVSTSCTSQVGCSSWWFVMDKNNTAFHTIAGTVNGVSVNLAVAQWINGTVTIANPGQYEIQANARDSLYTVGSQPRLCDPEEFHQASEGAGLAVVSINVAPVFLPLTTSYSVNEGQVLNIPVFAKDANGDRLTLSVSKSVTGANFQTGTTQVLADKTSQVQGRLNWTPNFSQAGTYSVQFKVVDSRCAQTVSAPVTIKVNDVNRSPVMSEIVNLINRWFYWQAKDPEEGSNVLYSYKIDNNAWTRPSRGIVIAIKYLQTQFKLKRGTHTFQVKAIDTKGAESAPKSKLFSL